MYTQVHYTSYRFSPPNTIPEELYAAAKSVPAEFRRGFITGHLQRPLKRVGRILLIAWGMAAVMIGFASLFDGSMPGSWSHTGMEVLAISGTMLALSGVLSAGSFINYALTYRKYWLRVQSAACDSESYSDFLIVTRERGLIQQR